MKDKPTAQLIHIHAQHIVGVNCEICNPQPPHLGWELRAAAQTSSEYGVWRRPLPTL